MYLGRFFQGDWIVAPLTCTNGSDVLTAPDAAPISRWYTPSHTLIGSTVKMQPKDKDRVNGLFEVKYQFTNATTGRHHVLMTYLLSGSQYAKAWTFDILPGGNVKGAYVGIHHYDRPHAKFIVGLTDGGTLEARQNPRV